MIRQFLASSPQITPIRFISLVVAIVFCVTSGPVSALSQGDIDAINQDSVHYEVDTGDDSTSCSDDSGPLVGSDNAERVYNFLTGKDLSNDQAAGVVGNLLAESGVIPNRKQGSGIQLIHSTKPIKDDIANTASDTGFGIAQWTTTSRQVAWLAHADKLEMDALSIELEAQYLFHELETNAGYGLKELKDAQDLRQATWIFLAFFERPKTVIDAGLAANPNQPTSGAAKDTLDVRERLAKTVTGSGGSSDDSCSDGGPDGGTGTPSFKANPDVKVDGSPPGPHKESNCTGTFTVGAASLKRYVEKTWIPPVTAVYGYDCRAIVGGSETSIHGMGRAIDIMITANTTKGRQQGDLIRNYMINNSTALGVQRVIWNRHTWSADQDGWRAYTGENPHTDHLHVEINLNASKNPNLGGQ